MEKLKRAESVLVALERAALATLLAFMVSLAFLQVALRQLDRLAGLSLSVLWGDTLLRHLVLWVGFLGAAAAAATDRQFAMDAAAQFFHGKTKARVALLCHAFAAWVCAGLARASWAYLGQERAHGGALFSIGPLDVTAWWLKDVAPGMARPSWQLGPFDVAAWWLEAMAPAGFALLLIHYSLKALEAGWASFWPDGEAPSTGGREPPA